MATAKETCPTMMDVTNANSCMENFAGMGSVAYFGLKSDLAAPLTRTENTYSTPTFKSGKGMYKFEAADEKQKIVGESAGYRKGFNLIATVVSEVVDATTSKFARAVNNNDVFVIIPDSDGNSQILYDKVRKVKADSGGINSDTGDSASSDRQMKMDLKLNGVVYPHLFVEEPTEGWDSLLASAKAAADGAAGGGNG